MKEQKASELRALSSLGWNSDDIARILQLPVNTVKKELYQSEKSIRQSLLEENRTNQRYSIEEHLQQKNILCINELSSIIRQSRIAAVRAYDLKERRNALTLIEKCELMIEDLVDENRSAETTINDVLKFISHYKKNGDIEI